MARSTARKMVNLDIDETSGVDRPAHLHDGWLVMKAADSDAVRQVLEAQTTEEDSAVEKTELSLDEATAALDKANERIAELEAAAAAAAETTADAATESADAGEEEILKSAPEPVRKALEAMKKQADEALAKAAELETVLKQERDAAADAAAVQKARGWKHLNIDAEKVGPLMRRLNEFDAALAKSVESVLDSVNAQAESSDIFAEIGRQTGVDGDAYTQMQALAKAAVTDGTATTFEQALAGVAVSNPDLYNRYLSEKGA